MTTEKKNKSFLVHSVADILFLSVFHYLAFYAGKGLLNDAEVPIFTICG